MGATQICWQPRASAAGRVALAKMHALAQFISTECITPCSRLQARVNVDWPDRQQRCKLEGTARAIRGPGICCRLAVVIN
jgi:hypothetical protein